MMAVVLTMRREQMKATEDAMRDSSTVSTAAWGNGEAQRNGRRFTRRRWITGAAGAASLAILGAHAAYAQQGTPVASPIPAGRDWRRENWVGSWAAGVHVATPGFGEEFPSQIFELGGRTLRQIVRLSLGGEQVRIRLANTFGEESVTIGAARAALRDGDEGIDPASDRQLTFSGLPSISIPAGAVVLSDPVDLAVPNLAELAVSLYFPDPTTSRTVHAFAFQTNYVSGEGDFTAEAALPVEEEILSWLYLTGVDVAVAEPAGAIVTLGDSITDGAFSTPDTNHRWPDLLADRLAASGQPMLGVLNQGIGGNRVLNDAPPEFPFMGPSALARFDREVLAMPGIGHLIVFEGINDIGLSEMADAAQRVSPDVLIAGLRQLAERAHEHGIVAYSATITPYEGTADYFTPEGEMVRQAVNDWIRTGGAFDAVIDFDAITRDPDHPARLLPAYNGGDHLHLNDVGFQAVADGIDLALFHAS
jgi:lysophospholipase L1-like esterase